jgi:hypothetical protein
MSSGAAEVDKDEDLRNFALSLAIILTAAAQPI